MVSEEHRIRLRYGPAGVFDVLPLPCCCSESHILVADGDWPPSVHVHTWDGVDRQRISAECLGLVRDDVIYGMQYSSQHRTLQMAVADVVGVRSLRACQVSSSSHVAHFSHFTTRCFSPNTVNGPKYTCPISIKICQRSWTYGSGNVMRFSATRDVPRS